MLAQVVQWGRAPDGTAVECVTLASPSGVTAVLLSWGATLARLLVPDRQGAPADVVLGFDDLAGYTGAHPHLGGTIGRYANRIAGARFSRSRPSPVRRSTSAGRGRCARRCATHQPAWITIWC